MEKKTKITRKPLPERKDLRVEMTRGSQDATHN